MKYAALGFLVGITCIKGECVSDKCRDIGNDCCAPNQEEAKCSDSWVPKRLGECGGDPRGKYHCCAPGTEPDPVCVETMCSSVGNDCCAPGTEEATCSNSSWVPKRIGECAGSRGGKYHCCAPGTEPDPVCVEYRCTSSGNDCHAPGQEEATCSDGWVPKRTGGQNGYYHCCPPGTEPDPLCVEDMCTSSGNDCCAPNNEEATCSSGWLPKSIGECGGDPQGSYRCCSPGKDSEPVCRQDMCTSIGNDCHLGGQEEATCSNSSWVPKRYARGTRYICCPPGTEPDPTCVEYKCTSSGNDCVAPGEEEATCSDSWVPKRTGEDGRYHCCPPGTEPDPFCVEEMCTSNGNDCCAPGDEEATCSEGWVPKRVGHCANDPKGKYRCCSPGKETEPACREDMCTSIGNDCHLGGQEEATCSNSSWVPKMYAKGTKYICCPPGTAPDNCVHNKCTSSGNDCCAPTTFKEEATCSSGLTPVRYGECFGDSMGQYYCCQDEETANGAPPSIVAHGTLVITLAVCLRMRV